MGVLEFLHERLCPILNYPFDISSNSVNIYNPMMLRGFTEDELNEEIYVYIYIELVKECLKAINSKVRVVVKHNIANSRFDLKDIEDIYVNSLSNKEQQLYNDSICDGLNSPYLICNRYESSDYNIFSFCVGRIKVFQIGDKLKNSFGIRPQQYHQWFHFI